MIDDACGRVLKTLDQQGFTDETIILFTSDHGEFLGNHGLLHKGPPPYCDLSRVSFLMAGPGIPEGASTAELSSHLDLMPTLLDLSGIAPQGLKLDGLSLRPVLEEKPLDRDALFLEFHPRIQRETYNHSLVTQDWRLTLIVKAIKNGTLSIPRAKPGEPPAFRSRLRPPPVAARPPGMRRQAVSSRIHSRINRLPSTETSR